MYKLAEQDAPNEAAGYSDTMSELVLPSIICSWMFIVTIALFVSLS
jgi:hypothetical protein